MKRRITTVLTAALLAVGLIAVPAAAQGGGLPDHGHVKLLHVQTEMDDGQLMLTGYARCIDMPARGNAGRAHHNSIHTGNAGQALQRAGHFVVPVFPVGPPWRTDCAAIARQLDQGLPVSLTPPPS